MSYILGLLISLLVTFLSFVFIYVLVDPYNVGLSVTEFFMQTFSGDWENLLAVCESAILEPINVFFVAPEAARIIFAFLPWILVAFIISFFFKRKGAARGGLSSTISAYLSVELYYFLSYKGEQITNELFLGPNPLYGYLVVMAVTLIVGFISGAISPFKKDKFAETTKKPSGPYYMPTESPSRDQYMSTSSSSVDPPALNFGSPSAAPRSPPPPPPRSSPAGSSASTATASQSNGAKTCEFCGSYIDYESDYCSVCGSRVGN